MTKTKTTEVKGAWLNQAIRKHNTEVRRARRLPREFSAAATQWLLTWDERAWLREYVFGGQTSQQFDLLPPVCRAAVDTAAVLRERWESER